MREEQEEGLAARVLGSFGITWKEVRAQVVRIVGQGNDAVTGQIQFTKHATRVLNHAQSESRTLGHNYIGREHILLGLVRESEGLAAQILLDLDADADKVRAAVIRWPGGSPD